MGELWPYVMEAARICVLLPVVGVLAWMLVRKDKDIREAQRETRTAEANRVEDLKVISDKLMSLNATGNETLGRAVESANATRETLKEVREAIKDLQDAMFMRLPRD